MILLALASAARQSVPSNAAIPPALIRDLSCIAELVRDDGSPRTRPCAGSYRDWWLGRTCCALSADDLKNRCFAQSASSDRRVAGADCRLRVAVCGAGCCPAEFRVLRQVAQFFAGFCLIANGAYISLGWTDRVGDCGEMLRTGTPIWAMLAFGGITIPLGLYLWHGLGSIKHFVRTPSLVTGRMAYSTVGVLMILLVAEFALSPR